MSRENLIIKFLYMNVLYLKLNKKIAQVSIIVLIV
jgi:hypothetical protein